MRGVNKVRSTIGKPVLFSVILDTFSEDEDERKYSIQMKAAFEKEGYPVYSALDSAMRSVARLYQFAALAERKKIK